MFSVALSVTLACTFLLRSMVLCAVPTFLAPAFPTRDSLPESHCKNTEFFDTDSPIAPTLAKSLKKNHFSQPYRPFFHFPVSSYRYLICVDIPFRIRNAHQINALWQICNGNFICVAYGFHQLSKFIVNLYFFSLNAFYRHLFLCRIGTNPNRTITFSNSVINLEISHKMQILNHINAQNLFRRNDNFIRLPAIKFKALSWICSGKCPDVTTIWLLGDISVSHLLVGTFHRYLVWENRCDVCIISPILVGRLNGEIIA